jgi:hypothetical protein
MVCSDVVWSLVKLAAATGIEKKSSNGFGNRECRILGQSPAGLRWVNQRPMWVNCYIGSWKFILLIQALKTHRYQ